MGCYETVIVKVHLLYRNYEGFGIPILTFTEAYENSKWQKLKKWYWGLCSDVESGTIFVLAARADVFLVVQCFLLLVTTVTRCNETKREGKQNKQKKNKNTNTQNNRPNKQTKQGIKAKTTNSAIKDALMTKWRTMHFLIQWRGVYYRKTIFNQRKTKT